jgi:hypothetical protein
MRFMRTGIIVVAVLTAALAGAVMMGTADAGKTATYYACADATSGALRRVPAEERCADGEERLVWSDGQQEPTPPPGGATCAIEVNETIFPKLTDVPFSEIAATKPCTAKWDGPTRITVKMTLKIIRAHDPKPDWITDDFNVAMLYLVNMPECASCHEPFNAGIVQPTYSECDSTGLLCTVEISFSGVTTLTAGIPIQLWLEERLEGTKFQNNQGDVLVNDESIIGATIKATGSLQAQQIKP